MRRGTSIVIVLDQAVVGHVDDYALGPVEGRRAVDEQLLSWLAEAAIEDRERRLHLEPRRDSALPKRKHARYGATARSSS
jgi:hypothetical protein